MTSKRSGKTAADAAPGRSRRAIFILIVIAIIAIPAVILLLRIYTLADPYLNQPTGVIVKPVFLEQQSHYYIYDGDIGHIHRPEARMEVAWEEHPLGRIVMQTNNLGFREDKETEEDKEDNVVRILVTGDSHIDGTVNNLESFPNRLEALLNQSGEPFRFEVLNGGTGFYGPQHYARFLSKYDYLNPDAFIVVMYTGNDFLDAVRTESLKDSSMAAGRDFGAWDRLRYFGRLAAARRVYHGAVGQGLNQAFFFKHFPGMKQTSLAVTRQEIERMRERCLARGIDFYLVLLPPRWEVEDCDMGWCFKLTRLVLWLSGEDLGVNRELRDSLAIWLDRNHIDYMDFADHEDHDPGRPLFWEADCHLSVYGHSMLAEAMHRRFNPSR